MGVQYEETEGDEMAWLSRNRRLHDAMRMVLKSAELAVSQGQYPTVELALFEMAANQRRAATLGVDVHNLLRQASRGDGTA